MQQPTDTEPVFRPSSRLWLAVLLGLVGVAGAILSIALLVPGDSAGNVEAVEAALSSPAPSTAGPVEPEASPVPEAPLVDEADAGAVISPNVVTRLDQLGAVETSEPVRLRIGGIGVDAPVVPHGVDQRTGEMDVPSNVDEVGWYEFGPSPGEQGSAVLAAHVDLAGQGPGVFYRLSQVDPGDTIDVLFADGSSTSFVVEARMTYEKSELPLETIFSRSGSPVLTLVTCGGGFDRSSLRYDSNVVVYAVPVGEVSESPAIERA